jgi:hypothetical protein
VVVRNLKGFIEHPVMLFDLGDTMGMAGFAGAKPSYAMLLYIDTGIFYAELPM